MLNVVSLVGVGGPSVGVSIFLEVTADIATASPPQQAQSDPDAVARLMRDVDPEFAADLDRISAAARNGVLDDRAVAVVEVVLGASTHLEPVQLRSALERALAAVVGRQEILEALELVSIVGVQSLLVALPLLDELDLGDLVEEVPDLHPSSADVPPSVRGHDRRTSSRRDRVVALDLRADSQRLRPGSARTVAQRADDASALPDDLMFEPEAIAGAPWRRRQLAR